MVNYMNYVDEFSRISKLFESKEQLKSDAHRYFANNNASQDDLDNFVDAMPPQYRCFFFADNYPDVFERMNKVHSFSFVLDETVEHVIIKPFMKEIEPFAFCGCKNLTEVDIYAKSDMTIDKNTFYKCEKLKKLTIYAQEGTSVIVDSELKKSFGENLQIQTAITLCNDTENIIDIFNSDCRQLHNMKNRIEMMSGFCKEATSFAFNWLSLGTLTASPKIKIAVVTLINDIGVSEDISALSKAYRCLLQQLETYGVYGGFEDALSGARKTIYAIYETIISKCYGISDFANLIRGMLFTSEQRDTFIKEVETYYNSKIEEKKDKTFVQQTQKTIKCYREFIDEIMKYNLIFCVDAVSYDFKNNLCVLDLNKALKICALLNIEEDQQNEYLRSLMIYLQVFNCLCSRCEEQTAYAHKKQLVVAKAVAFCAQMDWLKENEISPLHTALAKYSILSDVTFWPWRIYLHLNKYLPSGLQRDDVLTDLIKTNLRKPSKAYSDLCKLCECKPVKTTEELAEDLYKIKDSDSFRSKMSKAEGALIREYYKDEQRATKALAQLTGIPSHSFFRNIHWRSIVVTNNICLIENEAFFECKSLEEVTIYNDDLCVIEGKAFSGCSNLKKIRFLGKGRYILMPFAFNECSQKIEVEFEDLENGLYELQAPCIVGNEQSIILTYQKGNEKLAFYFKQAGVGKRGRNAFPAGRSCIEDVVDTQERNELTYYSFFKSNRKIIKIDESCSSVLFSAFFRCNELNEVILPKTAEVKNYAFYGCGNLEKVIAPDSFFAEMSIDPKAFVLCGHYKMEFESKKLNRLSKYKQQQFDYYRKEIKDPLCSPLFIVEQKARLLNINSCWLIDKVLTDFYETIECNKTMRYFMPQATAEKCTVQIRAVKQKKISTDEELFAEADEVLQRLYSRYLSLFSRRKSDLDTQFSQILRKSKEYECTEVYSYLKRELYDKYDTGSLRDKMIAEGKTEMLCLIDRALLIASEAMYKNRDTVTSTYDSADNVILLNLFGIFNHAKITPSLTDSYEWSMSALLNGYVMYLLLHDDTQKTEHQLLAQGLADCAEYFFVKDELKNEQVAKILMRKMNTGVYPSWPGGLYHVLKYQCYGNEKQVKLMVKDLFEMFVKDAQRACETVDSYNQIATL